MTTRPVRLRGIGLLQLGCRRRRLRRRLLFSPSPPSSNSGPGSHDRLFPPPPHYGTCLAFLWRYYFGPFLPRRSRVELGIAVACGDLLYRVHTSTTMSFSRALPRLLCRREVSKFFQKNFSRKKTSKKWKEKVVRWVSTAPKTKTEIMMKKSCGECLVLRKKTEMMKIENMEDKTCA